VANALGYCNLEYDLAAGRRGSRRSHVEPLLRALSGAEAALVVNNCAAALILALATLRRGGTGSEVLVSRGELVEIGGSFRIPEILESASVTLREVGTTNRTHLSDYERALTPATLAILRVHPSNFTLSGFTASPALGELTALAHAAGLPCLVDLGSDALSDGLAPALASSETLRGALAAGADAVMLSGDKLLGGPQAGLVFGREALVARMAEAPLMRALRPDKLALAALEYVLSARVSDAPERVPVLGMLSLSQAALTARATRLASRLAAAGVAAAVITTDDAVGGGSLPGTTLAGAGLAFSAPAGLSLDAWHARLRAGRPPVIARVAHERLVIALRTVPEADEHDLVQVLLTTLDIGAPAP
jgi:L-seryl-tRNA(Ser) seleniumtransferase